MEYGYNMRQWVGSGGIFDHLPTYMEIYGGRAKPKGPYKLCSDWMKEASYIRMVIEFWMSNPLGARGNIINSFLHNLLELKKLSKIWAHNKRILDAQSLRQIKADIATYENNHGGYTDQMNTRIGSPHFTQPEEKFLRTAKKSRD